MSSKSATTAWSTRFEKKARKCVIQADGSIKSFSQIDLSTKVANILTNCQVDIDRFFALVPITEYNPPVKRRGRKSKDSQEIRPEILPFGSCVFVQKMEHTRGKPLKKKSEKYFLHTVNAVFAIEEGKFVTIKIPSDGMLQLTGCSTDQHYRQSLEVVLKSFQDIERMTGERVYSIAPDFTVQNFVSIAASTATNTATQPSTRLHNVKAVFNTVMENRDFNLGFRVSRENLDNFLNEYTDWAAMFDSLNTSVQIKIPNERYKEEDIPYVEYDVNENKLQIVKQQMVPYTDYIKFFEDKSKKKNKKQKYFTFAVFWVGSVIMSARGPDMERVYNEFVNLMVENREHIEDIIIEEEPLRTVSTVSVNGQDVEDNDTEDDAFSPAPKNKKRKTNDVVKTQIRNSIVFPPELLNNDSPLIWSL